MCWGEKTPLPKTGNLSLSAMNLQKLFVKLTEKGGILIMKKSEIHYTV